MTLRISSFRSLVVLSGLSAACTGTVGGSAPGVDGTPSLNGAGVAGGAGSATSNPMSQAVCTPNRRLRKLSPDQVDATVKALGIPAAPVAQRLRDTLSLSDATFSSLAARLDLGQPHTAEIFDAAKQIATAAVSAGGPAESCASAAAPPNCVRDFLTGFGKQAFRRPLEAEEISDFVDYFNQERKADDAKTSLSSVLRVLFMSPSFLFRSELGAANQAGSVRLTQHEVASSIAYYLTDAPPDMALLAAADRGELASPEARAPHVRRLLAQGALGAGFSRFLGEYFRTAAIGSVSARDATIYPDYSADVARDYDLDTRAFFSEVMVNDDARFSTLLSAPYVMATTRSAPFYGLSGVTSAEPTRQMPPANQRAGILTQASWLTRFAHDKEGNPVGRGRFIRERLLCEAVPSPPPTVNAALPPPDAMRTQRERLEQHKSDPSCAGCHAQMDPLGFAFGNYDAVGRYQPTELGKPIDASGTSRDSAGESYVFKDGVELATELAASPVAQACFSRQVFFYAQGLANDDAGSCAFETVRPRLALAGESTVDVVVAMVSADEFFTRTQEPQ